MKNVIFAFGLMSIAAPAFGANSVAELANSMPGANPFAVLKRAFDSAGPAQINDYPRLVDLGTSRSNLKCVAVGEGNAVDADIVGVLTPSLIGRFDIKIPGTPDNGPLFPGTPDKVVTALSMTLITTSEPITPVESDESIVRLLSYKGLNIPVTSVSASGELQSLITAVSSAASDYLNTITYRKNGSELIFHEKISMPSRQFSGQGYGYCYPVSK